MVVLTMQVICVVVAIVLAATVLAMIRVVMSPKLQL